MLASTWLTVVYRRSLLHFNSSCARFQLYYSPISRTPPPPPPLLLLLLLLLL